MDWFSAFKLILTGRGGFGRFEFLGSSGYHTPGFVLGALLGSDFPEDLLSNK